MNTRQFKKFKNKQQDIYRQWTKCYCPALKQNIYFTSHGLHHLRFKISRKERTHKEQIYKLNLLPLVPHIVKTSIRTIAHKKRYIKNKSIRYWAISGQAGEGEIKVILRKVNEGKIIFWSVMHK